MAPANKHSSYTGPKNAQALARSAKAPCTAVVDP